MINDEIKKQVLELSGEERAELAHILIDSINPKNKIESEEAWSEELKNRIDRYERGESSSKPWSEVKKNAQGLLD